MGMVLVVLGAALCIACMAMMGGMVLSGIRRALRHRDGH